MNTIDDTKLKEQYNTIKGIVLSAQLKLKVTKQLFAGEENVDVLRWSADLAWWCIQSSLYQSIILEICKITDPAQQGKNKKHKNLTLERLAKEIDEVKLEEKCVEYLNARKEKFESLRTIRDKAYAHLDLSDHKITRLETEQVDEAIKALIEVINKIGSFLGEGVGRLYDSNKYGKSPGQRDGRDIIKQLRAAKASHIRIIRGRTKYIEGVQLQQSVRDKVLPKERTIPIDTELLNLVYELYGLSDEAIKEDEDALKGFYDTYSAPNT